MFVDDRTRQVKRIPLHDVTGVAGGGGQGDDLFAAHAVQIHRHGERTNLRVADAVVGNALYKGLDLIGGQRLTVAFQANQFLGEQGVLRGS